MPSGTSTKLAAHGHRLRAVFSIPAGLGDMHRRGQNCVRNRPVPAGQIIPKRYISPTARWSNALRRISVSILKMPMRKGIAQLLCPQDSQARRDHLDHVALGLRAPTGPGSGKAASRKMRKAFFGGPGVLPGKLPVAPLACHRPCLPRVKAHANRLRIVGHRMLTTGSIRSLPYTNGRKPHEVEHQGKRALCPQFPAECHRPLPQCSW